MGLNMAACAGLSTPQRRFAEFRVSAESVLSKGAVGQMESQRLSIQIKREVH
jgi:hypothetical protein